MTPPGLRAAIREALENPRTDVPGGAYIDRQTETVEEAVREYLTSTDPLNVSFFVPPGFVLTKQAEIDRLHNECEALRIERDAARGDDA